jgi:hypothetical protein
MMRTRVRAIALMLVAAALAVPAAPVSAATRVWVPAGTQVGLRFLTPVASDKIATGAKVHFKVLADVVQNRHVVIRSGTPAAGTVTEVQKPGAFGQDAKVVIGFIATKGVDGAPIKLTDVVASKATISKARAGAAGASVAGMIVLGPIGLLGGALIRGNDIEVPPGVAVLETIRSGAYVNAS